jgi:hypothetical protein
MKACTRCGQNKPFDAFGAYARGRDGLRAECKICMGERVAEWRAENPARARERDAARRAANREKLRAYKSAWRKTSEKAANERLSPSQAPALVLARALKWQKDKPHLANARNARRRAARRKATPAWANDFFIEEAYHLAQLRTEMFGFPWHVDHIVPLQSKIVCGLHWELNLAVIPGADNCAKRNLRWPDMP